MKTDVALQQDIIAELSFHPALKTAQIGVAVNQGVVTLNGQVESYFEKTMAESAVKNVAGVKAIAENINVIDSKDSEYTDAAIAKAIIDALYWNSAVNEERIKIKVENGVVTLEGETEWDFQRTQAKKTIEKILGVKMVCNCIKLKLKPTPLDLQQQLKKALARIIPQSSRIMVDIIQQNVVLRGNVSSLNEKEAAEKVARNAKGVESVENRLEVKI